MLKIFLTYVYSAVKGVEVFDSVEAAEKSAYAKLTGAAGAKYTNVEIWTAREGVAVSLPPPVLVRTPLIEVKYTNPDGSAK